MQSSPNPPAQPAVEGEAPLFIRRIEVAEGFLDGLDVEFSPGLNVLIGARGTGKTSLIELIRFCLGASAFTEDAAERGLSQALSVLQGGTVRVTLGTDAGEVTISRDGSTTSGLSGTQGFACTVLAQNEIEAVGAQPGGRLHLVDRFRVGRADIEQRAYGLRADVSSLTAELAGLLEEGQQLAEQSEALAGSHQALIEAQGEQQQILESVQASEQERANLVRLQAVSSLLSVRGSTFARAAEALTVFGVDVEALIRRGADLLDEWPPEGGAEDLLAACRLRLAAASDHLQGATGQVRQALSELENLEAANTRAGEELSIESRELRQQLEALQVGASAVTRRVAELQERAGQQSALQGLLQERRMRFQEMQSRRNLQYAALDGLRERIFTERVAVASALGEALGPTVRVQVTRSAGRDQYTAAIVSALRGSGLHYNSLAPLLARAMSPLELVMAVEGSSTSSICQAVDVAPERALSLIAALKRAGTADIISSAVDDLVTLELLDGNQYKDSGHLSIGQRCTVVLPVLLSQHGDPLLVDQPEDHLDNAFVASTLVKSLRSRTADDQFIFASHNANIPVLGNADRIVVLDSDGHRGFVLHQGPLHDAESVRYVNALMEGGPEAFKRRAKFYGGGLVEPDTARE